jgi:hypothetical protein
MGHSMRCMCSRPLHPRQKSPAHHTQGTTSQMVPHAFLPSARERLHAVPDVVRPVLVGSHILPIELVPTSSATCPWRAVIYSHDQRLHSLGRQHSLGRRNVLSSWSVPNHAKQAHAVVHGCLMTTTRRARGLATIRLSVSRRRLSVCPEPCTFERGDLRPRWCRGPSGTRRRDASVAGRKVAARSKTMRAI